MENQMGMTLFFTPSDTHPAKHFENEEYTDSAAHLGALSIAMQKFLQKHPASIREQEPGPKKKL